MLRYSTSMSIHGKFRSAFVNNSLASVNLNQAKFQSFTEGHRMIGTQGLRGCLVVLIASRRAAILAHIGPASAESVMSQVANLYSLKQQTYFQAKDVWVVMAKILDVGSSPLDAVKQVILRKLTEMGISNPQDASYSFHLGSDGQSPEFPDKGTDVAGLVGGRVEAWVENRLLRFW